MSDHSALKAAAYDEECHWSMDPREGWAVDVPVDALKALLSERDAAVEALREASEVYDGMEDGNGDMCPTLVKIRFVLASLSQQTGEP